MTMELYKVHRPKLFKHVIGQKQACGVLTRMLKRNAIPHALLFTGPSGCGKTTLARILQGKLDCSDRDFNEINCADFRGVDMVREIRTRMGLSPIGGKTRIWLIDEAHQLSKDAQNALLKMLEDTPSHVYFMMCTTEPGKLITTIQNRSTEIKVRALTGPEIIKVVVSVCLAAGLGDEAVSDIVVDRIIECCDGSARKALVILDSILDIEEEEEQLNAILSSDSKRQAIDIARALMNPRVKWGELAKILKSVDEEPEQIRYLILGYVSSVMLNGGKNLGRANLIINVFRDNFWDSKKAGLIAACYEVATSK